MVRMDVPMDVMMDKPECCIFFVGTDGSRFFLAENAEEVYIVQKKIMVLKTQIWMCPTFTQRAFARRNAGLPTREETSS